MCGRSYENIKIACNFGPTELVERIRKVSNKLDINEKAVVTLLRIVGEDPNVPDDKLDEALTKVASDYKRLEAQAAALNPDNPTARRLVEEAQREIDAGHFGRTHALLRQATQVQISAAHGDELVEKGQAAEAAELLGAAASTATEGGVALTERQYLEAAELFGQAADLSAGHGFEHTRYTSRQAFDKATSETTGRPCSGLLGCTAAP